MMNWIDLRSDTVTMPTEKMRAAMAAAPVGDDVYGDDPTVCALEALAAKVSGKEAALFVPSGTMGNQLAIMTHTRRGDEIIVGENAHIAVHEVGATAVLSGVSLRTLHCPNDILTPEAIARAIRPDDIHMPRTGLLCLENALAGGRVVPLAQMQAAADVAHEKGIPVHLDGARLFNAATVLGVTAAEVAACADSVMFCLSKGLCAPVGSMLCGSREFVERARKNRKLLGGGMRQIGILAAAGIIAIEEMTGRLQEDHDNARYMAQQLLTLPGISLDPDSVEISMVFFALDREAEFLAALPQKLLEKGIKINGVEDGLLRFVTHYWVNREQIDYVIATLREVLA